MRSTIPLGISQIKLRSNITCRKANITEKTTSRNLSFFLESRTIEIFIIFVDMQTSFARYIYFVNSICSRFAQPRYDINLVAIRQHIKCVSTYRVCKTYRKSYKRFISMKKRHFSLSKNVFFSGTPDAIRTHDLQSRSLTLYPTELQAHIFIYAGRSF